MLGPRAALAVLETTLLQLFGNENREDLDFLEFFAGDQAITYGLRAYGFQGRPFDMRYRKFMDLLKPQGFAWALGLGLKVRKGPKLSSFLKDFWRLRCL